MLKVQADLFHNADQRDGDHTVEASGWQPCITANQDVLLYQNAVPTALADQWFKQLMAEIRWQSWHIQLYGKSHLSPRQSCWYGDAQCSYRYSGVRRQPEPWSPTLLQIRDWAEQFIQPIATTKFNSVLANLYQHGQHSMGWHSDNEPELGQQPVIASLSLGGTRIFRFRPTAKPNHQRRISTAVRLCHGSLLLMQGNSQIDFQHALPKTSAVVARPRINLTFRWLKK